jgi:hypothetical protein
MIIGTKQVECTQVPELSAMTGMAIVNTVTSAEPYKLLRREHLHLEPASKMLAFAIFPE